MTLAVLAFTASALGTSLAVGLVTRVVQRRYHGGTGA